MATEFFAFLSRMRHIRRWSLMYNTYSENIQEHSHQVAVLAHGLALIRREILGLPCPDPDRCAVAALYHDASEILTGDLPTPIKYHDPALREAYKRVERLSGEKLLAMLPEVLRPHYESHILESDPEVEPIVKGADKLSAYLKCVEELKAGNREFDSAARQTMKALLAMDRPEIEWFLKEALPAYSLTLDQLQP